jgi:hypothetical protein
MKSYEANNTNQASTPLNLFVLFTGLLAMMAILVFHGLNIPTLNYENQIEATQYLYLLSTIAQSLAAILALSITITIIVLQMQSYYSHLYIRDYLDFYSGVYIILCILTIALSFFLLSNPPSRFLIFNITMLTKTLLIMSLGCLFFLIPFLLSFREKLSLEVLIKSLTKKAEKELTEEPNKEPEAARIIQNIVIRASQLNDYEAFRLGAWNLSQLSLVAKYKNQSQRFSIESPQLRILERIKSLFKTTINDSHSPGTIIDTLGESYMYAAQSLLGPAFLDGHYLLGELASIAINKNKPDLASLSCRKLTRIGLASISSNMPVIGVVSDTICSISLVAYKNSLHDLVHESAMAERDIGILLMDISAPADVQSHVLANIKNIVAQHRGIKTYIFQRDSIGLTLLSYFNNADKCTEALNKYKNFNESH